MLYAIDIEISEKESDCARIIYIFIRESYSNQKTVKMGCVWLNNLDKNRQLLLLLVEEKQNVSCCRFSRIIKY